MTPPVSAPPSRSRSGLSIGRLILSVNVFVLLVPVMATVMLRIYDQHLVHQTERRLIAESVLIGEAWRSALLDAQGRAHPGAIEPANTPHAKFFPIEPVIDLHAALADADIVSTATMSSAPILPGALLRPGTHVDLIGAFTETMREADDEVLLRGRLFVDARETTVDHIGELTIPLAAGTISRTDIQGDLRDLVAGSVKRDSMQEITVFKNGGGAHLDLMTADLILTICGV